MKEPWRHTWHLLKKFGIWGKIRDVGIFFLIKRLWCTYGMTSRSRSEAQSWCERKKRVKRFENVQRMCAEQVTKIIRELDVQGRWWAKAGNCTSWFKEVAKCTVTVTERCEGKVHKTVYFVVWMCKVWPSILHEKMKEPMSRGSSTDNGLRLTPFSDSWLTGMPYCSYCLSWMKQYKNIMGQ